MFSQLEEVHYFGKQSCGPCYAEDEPIYHTGRHAFRFSKYLWELMELPDGSAILAFSGKTTHF